MSSHLGPSDDAVRISCLSCPKTFVRKTHMLRHAKQHHNPKPFRCQFCSKEYTRSDTLRDHYTACDYYRGELAPPVFYKTGRKKHACEECTRLKVRCDQATPCMRCSRLRKPCVRSFDEDDKDFVDSDPFTDVDLNVNRHSVQFLLRDSGSDDFAEYFPKSKENHDIIHAEIPEHRAQVRAPRVEIGDNDSSWPGTCVGLPSADMDFETLFASFSTPANGEKVFRWPWEDFPLPFEQYQRSLAPLSFPVDPVDDLGSRSIEIRNCIEEAMASLRIRGDEPFDEKIVDALNIVEPERLHAFVQLYFHHWHRHGPILHEPSFDSSTVALPLLIAVFAIGGMYSENSLELIMMKTLLDLMEVAVYSNLSLEDDYLIRDGILSQRDFDSDDQRRIEEFQGAYLMIVVQYWAGNAAAKQRVRKQRFPMLVSIARSREALSIQHPENLMLSNEEGFRLWVRRESMLRTMNIMITLDNAFGIFNNLPPYFSWSELGLELPCDTQYFEATSYEDMRDRACFPRRKLKLTDAFQLFFRTGDASSKHLTAVEKGTLNMLDLQIIVHAFYTLVWQQLFSNPVATVLPATINSFISSVKMALRNWKRVWDEAKSGIEPAKLRGMGFPGSAESYWLVTQFIVYSFEKAGGRPSLPIKADVTSIGAHLKLAM